MPEPQDETWHTGGTERIKLKDKRYCKDSVNIKNKLSIAVLKYGTQLERLQ